MTVAILTENGNRYRDDVSTSPAGTTPSDPLPLPSAPGAERHPALGLVNTRTMRPSGEFDDLAETAAAGDWLAGVGLLPARTSLDPGSADRLRSLRETVRTLLAAHLDGVLPDAAALAELNAALNAAQFTEELRWDDPAQGPRRESLPSSGTPVDAALTRLARNAVDLLTGPEAASIAACGAPGCIRYFLRTHAARQWCSTRCGDRVRAARHYARNRTPGRH